MADEKLRAQKFVEEVKERCGQDLLTAMLYGSFARGEHRPGASDLNLLLVLKGVGPDVLAKLVVPTRGWLEDGNPPPLLMSEAEWQGSADVFPIEYSDIQSAHILLAGSDPFAGIEVDREHLRLQLEHELRSKKIQLRESLIASGDTPARVGSLLVRSLSTFMAMFRAVLRLTGSDTPNGAAAIIRQVGELADFDSAPVLRVLDAKLTQQAMFTPLDGPVVAGYLAAVEATVHWLDKYESRLEL